MIYLIQYYLFTVIILLILFSLFYTNFSYYIAYNFYIPRTFDWFKLKKKIIFILHPILNFLDKDNVILNKLHLNLIKDFFWKIKIYRFVKNIVEIIYKQKLIPNMNFSIISLFILTFFILILFLSSLISIDGSYEWIRFFDNTAYLAKLILFCMSIFYLIMVKTQIENDRFFKNEYIFMAAFAILGLIVLLDVHDFFETYLALEMYGLSVVTLVGLNYFNRTTLEASFKYFTITALSSAVFLFGFSLLYASSGHYDFTDLRLFLFTFLYIKHLSFFFATIAIIFILLGFLIKMGIVPFNFWLANCYSAFPLITIFFLLMFPKFIFTVFLIKLCYYVFSIFLNYINLLFLVIIISSSIINNILALYQTKFKKILIYASFSNLSFFLLLFYINTFYSIVSFFSFFIIYFFNIFSIFTIYGLVSLSKKTNLPLKITYFINFFKINEVFSIIFISFLLSLSGLPPFSGFFSKLYFLILLFDQNSFSLGLFLLLVNLFTVYYYLRIMKLILQTSDKFKYLNIEDKVSSISISIIFLLNCLAFFYFDFLYNFISVSLIKIIII